MTIYCPKCGRDISDETDACPYCGFRRADLAPGTHEPQRTILARVGRFVFLIVLPYLVAGSWVLGGAFLRRLPRMIVFTAKLAAFGFVLWAVAMFVLHMHAAMTL